MPINANQLLDREEKIRISAKNFRNYKKNQFCLACRGPLKTLIFIFQKILKKNVKNGFPGKSQTVRETKSPILVILALLLRNLWTNVWYHGQIDPTPP